MMNQKMNSEEVMIGGRMYKRRHWQGQGQGQASKRLQKHKQKHLYLVLDDWDKGYTIRKIDADSPDLSDPPVLRLVSPAPLYHMFFAALGSHIFALSNQHPATLVYHTDTAGLSTGPALPDALLRAFNIFIPVADTLYAFAYYFKERPYSFEVMSSTKDLHSSIPSMGWSWKSVPAPFTKDERICSYAVHPDGSTIFVSARTYGVRDQSCRTFSFDTSHREWRCHGEWALPFIDQAYFDGDLDAWVGLHEDGYICSCQVPSRSSSSSTMQLDWKMAKDKLWSEQKLVALGPTLTCMGNARFCLVDHGVREGLDTFDDSSDGCNLHITTFRLRYSHKGELQIFERTTNSYQVSKHTSCPPVAFWM